MWKAKTHGFGQQSYVHGRKVEMELMSLAKAKKPPSMILKTEDKKSF
jgi:hypothetical protein